MTEIKGKDDEKKTYTLKMTTIGAKKEDYKEKEKKVKKSKDAKKGDLLQLTLWRSKNPLIMELWFCVRYNKVYFFLSLSS